jgi:hypothetical protein
MAQGILSALTGGEQATLTTNLTAIHDAIAVVIADYPAKTAYSATLEKEILFNDKLTNMLDECHQLMACVAAPTILKREK